MAIDSSGSGPGTITLLRDTITSVRGAEGINRINPTPDDPDRPRAEDVVIVSETAASEPEQAERQELDGIRQGLADASGAGNVALAGAQSVSDTLSQIGTRLQELSGDGLSAERRATLTAEVQTLARQGLETIDRATFNGVNLLDAENDEDLEVVADQQGGTETVRDQNLRPAFENLQNLALDTPEGAQAALETVFAEAQTTVDTAVRELTEDTDRIGESLTAVQDRLTEIAGADDGVDTGLGADEAQQTADQVATQLQQVLNGQSLGLVNQRPESLVGLFR